VTLRGQQDDYQETGGRFYSPLTIQADNHLTTAYAQYRLDHFFVSRITAGQHQRLYIADGKTSHSEIRNRRDVVDWQNSWAGVKDLELVGGAAIERARQNKSGDNSAAYLTGNYRPVQDVTLNAGLRYDDFETFGSVTTWRSGIAWLPVKNTKVRATIGTGFCAPTNDDINGVPAWGWLENHNLKAEKSTGWDFGVDQDLWDNNATASVTYFQTRYRDRLDYVSDPITWIGKMENLTRSTSQGVEVALTLRVGKRIENRVAYTYLDARNDTANVRLPRQPRHVADAETRVRPVTGLTVGAGLHIVAAREATAKVDMEDYTTVRLFASYEIVKNVLLKARVENALDEHYEEVYGYPALSRGVYGSLEWKF
jgi:vitamin B12 transporter